MIHFLSENNQQNKFTKYISTPSYLAATNNKSEFFGL